MGKTAIQWSEVVWNPVVGCTKVSQGCKNCYAKTLHDKRHKANRGAAEGTPYGEPMEARRMGERLPMPEQYDVPFEVVQLMPDRLEKPLRWRKPRMVFVNSVSDLFHPAVPDEYIDRVFAVMARTPRHTYQVLTKRPERMREYMTRHDVALRWAMLAGADAEAAVGWTRELLPNVWLGVSVENQQAADERLPLLQATPARVHFLSCEPLLGPVDLRPFDGVADGGAYWKPAIDWVIVGGESGAGARPCDLEWVRSLVDQGRKMQAAVFVKQLGRRPVSWVPEIDMPAVPLRLRHRAGGDPDEWPEDLRVREFPAQEVVA